MTLSLGKHVDRIIYATLSTEQRWQQTTLRNRNTFNLYIYWVGRDNECLKMIKEVCLKTCQIHISMVYNSIP